LKERVIAQKLNEWSDRKRSMSSGSKYIDVSVRYLQRPAYLSSMGISPFSYLDGNIVYPI
jgi:hypothetical protein